MSSNVRNSILAMDDPLVELIVQICSCRVEEAQRLLAISGNDVSAAVARFINERNASQIRMPIHDQLHRFNGNNGNRTAAANRMMRGVMGPAATMTNGRQHIGEGLAPLNRSTPYSPRGRGVVQSQVQSNIVAGPLPMSVAGQAMSLHSRRRFNSTHPVVTASRMAMRMHSIEMLGPSIEIAYTGTLNAARQHAESRLKWLVVNIQCNNIQSHTIQDEVLAHKGVKHLLRRYFLLWQVDCGTIEGRRFLQSYHCPRLHHLCVIDPSTGDEIWHFSNPDTTNVLSGLQQVLQSHGEFALNVITEPTSNQTNSEVMQNNPTGISNLLTVQSNPSPNQPNQPNQQVPIQATVDNPINNDNPLEKRHEELTMLKLHYFNASGENEHTIFHWTSDTKLQKMRVYICEQLQHISQQDYKLICLQPRLVLESKHNHFTLKELGLHPSANLHLTVDN